jgi:hypothetical protein
MLAVYLVIFFLFLTGPRGLEHFFRQRPSLPIGCRILQIVRVCQRQEKITGTALLTQIEAITASKSALIIG